MRFKNISGVTQILYTGSGTAITVEPGQFVESDKLGYSPADEMGFVKSPVSGALSKLPIVGSLFGLESRSSKRALRDDQVEIGKVVELNPEVKNGGASSTMSPELKKGLEILESIDEKTSPNYRRAVLALLGGSSLGEFVVPREQDVFVATSEEGESQVVNKSDIHGSETAARPSKLAQSISGNEFDRLVNVDMADPILIPTPKEIAKQVDPVDSTQSDDKASVWSIPAGRPKQPKPQPVAEEPLSEPGETQETAPQGAINTTPSLTSEQKAKKRMVLSEVVKVGHTRKVRFKRVD